MRKDYRHGYVRDDSAYNSENDGSSVSCPDENLIFSNYNGFVGGNIPGAKYPPMHSHKSDGGSDSHEYGEIGPVRSVGSSAASVSGSPQVNSGVSYNQSRDGKHNPNTINADHRGGRAQHLPPPRGTQSRQASPHMPKEYYPTSAQLGGMQAVSGAANYDPNINPPMRDQRPDMDMSFMTPTPYRLQLPEQADSNSFKNKRTYRVPLTREGNLVIDLPAPRQLMSLAKYTEPPEEFCYTRYTAVTCDPDEFVARGYRLKVQEMGRKAELLIALTMYNEDENLFLRSMTSVLKNIRHFCSRSHSSVWGKESWKRIVVCVISDGRNKINHRVLGVLGVMGVYQDGIMKDHVNERSVTAHLFEFTSQIYINEAFEIKNSERGYVPTQIIFCLKEKNAKKINSHRWLFQAFAPLLSTNICVLIDVGTQPGDTSLYHLWKAFKDPNVAGACGEIVADAGRYKLGLLNPLICAQNFEYKTSNILDKALESICGYISVLPGAFSAYRYSALVGRPLKAYFLGETMENEVSLLTANTYLAEDRILCLELIAKKGSSWLLKYVRLARAKTDVPSTIPELISQRRRWLNGSFCAGVHASLSFYRVIFVSGHGIIRKLILTAEFLYNFICLILGWFGISLFFLTFYFVIKGASSTDLSTTSKPFRGYEEQVLFYSKYAYTMAIIAVFISSMGNRPQGLKIIFLLSVITFALFNTAILYVVVFQAISTIAKSSITLNNVPEMFLTDKAFRTFAISLAFTLGVFIISSIAYLSPWHLVTSSLQYFLIMPTYVNIMPIYSFCNLHDVTWGTKQSTGPATDLGAAKTFTSDTGLSMFDVNIRGSQREIDTNYGKFIHQLENKSNKKIEVKDIFSMREDYLRSFRTKVVLMWILTNGAVSVVLTSDLLSELVYRKLGLSDNTKGAGAVNPFLTCFSYVVFVLNGVRLIGSILYLIF